MDLAHPANDGVRRYLGRHERERPALAAPASVADPYYNCGCHPDIVEWLWDKIAPALPGQCRFLVFGTPALVHPPSGLVFALGLGTQYGLRLADPLLAEAIRRGARTQNRWSSGEVMDITQDLGPDWCFGAWAREEAEWCRTAWFA
jgi:hypothetical protein